MESVFKDKRTSFFLMATAAYAFILLPRIFGDICSRWKKLKDRTDGALLDWTRQHVPPWDFVYLNCHLAAHRALEFITVWLVVFLFLHANQGMKTLSCRPLDDAEPLPVVVPRSLSEALGLMSSSFDHLQILFWGLGSWENTRQTIVLSKRADDFLWMINFNYLERFSFFLCRPERR